MMQFNYALYNFEDMQINKACPFSLLNLLIPSLYNLPLYTMFKNNKQEKLQLLKALNNICHKEDNTRLTSLACFAMC